MTGFVEYVGLGYNCEVAYQFRRVGFTRANFFDWASTPHQTVTAIIEAGFEGAREQTSDDIDGMIRDDVFYHRFHGPHSAEKVAHLTRRFLNPIGRRCYFLKADYISPAEVVRLMDALDEISTDYALVILRLSAVHYQTSLEVAPRVFPRILHRFAPLDDASDGHYLGWEAVFAEFPLTQPASTKVNLAAIIAAEPELAH